MSELENKSSIPVVLESDKLKETKEALTCLNEIVILLIDRFKDGVQFGDFTAIIKKLAFDTEFQDVLSKGYEGYNKIPDEMKGMDFKQSLDLVQHQFDYIEKIADAFNENQSKK